MLTLLIGSWAFNVAQGQIISGIDPQFGPTGTQVAITGQGLGTATSVEFGDQIPAEFQVIADDTIVAIVPPDGLTSQIKVNTLIGAASSFDFFFVSPRFTSFFPRQGSTNTTVTINGANFLDGGTWVVFGSITSQVVNVTAPTQLQTEVPDGATNSIIYVHTGAGNATSVVEFISTSEPLIQDFTPENGLPGSTVNMTINGANFLSATNVTFNGTNAAFTVTADTQISVPTIPVDATSGEIRVGTEYGEAFSEIDFIVGPTIDSFSPLAGSVGDLIRVFGNGFLDLTNVTVNGVRVLDGAVVGPTLFEMRIPEDATTGKIHIEATTGEGFSEMNLTIGPFVSGFFPEYAPVGTQIRINGAGFDNDTRVFFGDVEALDPNSSAPTIVFASVPNGATNAPISVVTTDATNTTSQTFFVTTGIPFIDNFRPASGPAGTKITLEGVDFSGITSVKIGGIVVGFDEPAASTRMEIVVPPGALTGKIEVSNANGTGTSFDNFYASPWTTGFSPTSAIAGTIVQLTGTNFNETVAVYFGGEPVQLFLDESNELFVILTTNALTGPIQVDTLGGSFITTSNFTVLPNIIEVAPSIGPVGTDVVISGTSFHGVTNVSFNGVSSDYNVVSPQSIETTVPDGATSGSVRVGTFDGETFSPMPFIVTKPTRLAVSENTSTNLVLPGESVTYISVVTNSGPSEATGVVLTNTFPTAVELQSADSSQGDGCGITDNIVSCGLGVLSTNQNATVTIEATFPISGAFTNTVTISSVEGDTTAGDNTAQSVVVAVPVAARTLDIELLSASNQVVLSWEISPVPFQLQFIRELGNTNVNWSNILIAPYPVNGTNWFTNGTEFAEEYYRLLY